jgi:thiamine-phosphate pyrophosphorylase
MNQNQLKAFRFQFITHQTDKYSYLQSAEMALQGGCKWIQLRMKDAPVDEVEVVAWQVKKLCESYQAVFLMDDYVELCKKVGADGVHLGKEDMHPKQAREILGDGFIIGSTCNTFEDIELQSKLPIDYIGLGPFRFTETKKKLAPVLGLGGYSDIINNCRKSGIDIPIVAIGGITKDDILSIMQTGVQGVALSGAVLQAENPVGETKMIVDELKMRK